MTYLKKQIDADTIERTRINLSMRDNKLSPDPVCDFCSDTNPVWVYAASRMASGEARPCWRWMACAGCSRSIDNGNWDKLVRHMVNQFRAIWLKRHGGSVADDLIEKSVRRGLQQFRDWAVTAQHSETGLPETGENKIPEDNT
jgi:hypothetical protein